MNRFVPQSAPGVIRARVRMRLASVAVGLAAVAVAGTVAFGQGKSPAGKAKTPAVSKAFAPLQGTWALTAPDGQPLAPGGLTLTITGDTYAQGVNGQVNERGTMKLDATKQPMAIDLIIGEGSDAGKTQLGLIEVKGDAMTGVFNLPAATVRPTALTGQQGMIAFVGKKQVK